MGVRVRVIEQHSTPQPAACQALGLGSGLGLGLGLGLVVVASSPLCLHGVVDAVDRGAEAEDPQEDEQLHGDGGAHLVGLGLGYRVIGLGLGLG